MGLAHRGRDQSQVQGRGLTVSLTELAIMQEMTEAPHCVGLSPEDICEEVSSDRSQAPNMMKRWGFGGGKLFGWQAVTYPGSLFCVPFLCYLPAMKNLFHHTPTCPPWHSASQ